MTRHDNYDGGGREFWAKLIRNELVAARSLAVSDEKEIELKTGATASLIVGAKEIGGKGYGYLVAVAANRRDVYAYEAWGPTEALAADRGKIEASVVSLAVRP